MLGLAINSVGVLVLIAVLVYAWRLDRKLKDLEKNRLAIQKSLGDFSQATSRAESAIQQLRSTAQEVDGNVESQLSRAVSLRDELNFLIDAADKIANRITAQTQEAQAKAQNIRPPVAAEKTAASTVKTVITTKGEETLKPVRQEKAPPPAFDKISFEKEEDKKLPAWLKPAEKNSSVVKTVVPAPPPASAKDNAPVASPPQNPQSKSKRQSEAEIELQQALENMR